MGKGQVIGYARVSSKSQNLDRQIQELEKYGCDEIYTDMASGKNFERPGYQKLKSHIRRHDLLVVHDLSRFGRHKEEIMSEWQEIFEQGVDITVLNMPALNTRQFRDMEGLESLGKLISDIFLTVMAWTVQEERIRIKIAQREGIEIAKKKGKFKGRPTKYHENAKNPQDRLIYSEIVRMIERDESVQDISKKTGVTRSTIYKIKNSLQPQTVEE